MSGSANTPYMENAYRSDEIDEYEEYSNNAYDNSNYSATSTSAPQATSYFGQSDPYVPQTITQYAHGFRISNDSVAQTRAPCRIPGMSTMFRSEIQLQLPIADFHAHPAQTVSRGPAQAAHMPKYTQMLPTHCDEPGPPDDGRIRLVPVSQLRNVRF
jgi:hypothetical protein